MTVISRAKTAWQFRDELAAHVRKIAAVYAGAQKVLRTKHELTLAKAKERELTALADFMETIQFTELEE